MSCKGPWRHPTAKSEAETIIAPSGRILIKTGASKRVFHKLILRYLKIVQKPP